MLPEHVNVMALTATATVATRSLVCQALGITKPAVVYRSPNRSNIRHSVQRLPKSFQEAFEPLINELRQKRASCDRAIICCTFISGFGMLWGKKVTNLSGNSSARLVAMFSACMH